MTLWEKHQVMPLDNSSIPYRLEFRSAPKTPELDKRIAAWRDKNGEPFPERDLAPHRVGITGITSTGGISVLNCFGASWAQRMLLSDPKVRGELPENERLHILSMVCVVRTSDDQIPLSFRSEKMVIYPSSWHGSAAGFTDFHPAMESGSPLFQTFLELEEELNVLPSHIRSMRQLGLCQHLATISLSAIEYLVLAEVNLSAAELVERANTAKDSWEGKVHTFSEEKVLEMLKAENFVPSGAAAVMLALGI